MKLRIVAALLPLLVGCGVDRDSRQAVQQSVSAPATEIDVAPETFALGTSITPRGAIPQDAVAETVVRGGELFLSVDVSSASSSHRVEVKWIGPEGTVIRSDVKGATQGLDYLPFSSGETRHWTPGQHRARVLIDGRSVSEKAFVVM